MEPDGENTKQLLTDFLRVKISAPYESKNQPSYEILFTETELYPID